MSNKRAATSDLNQDNWNEEEAPEEMGTYKSAPSNTLKMRPMKRAKRRGITGDNEGPSVFKNFKGFGTVDSSAVPTFSFLNYDGEKPKLSIGSSFPSFSFSKNAECDKTGESKSVPLNSSVSSNKTTSFFSSVLPTTLKNNTDKGKNESSSKPLFQFGTTDINANKNDSVESSPQSTLSFGVPTTNKSADNKTLTSSFGFSSSKKEGESESYKPIFSFGVVDTNKNTNSTESSPKSSFVFGVSASNKTTEDKAVLSTFNFNPSKTVGDASPVFKFGVNASVDTKINNNSSPLTTQQGKLPSDNTNNENSLNSLKSQNKEPQSSKVNGITETPKAEKRKRSTTFLANLKALNLGVMKWVQQHLDKNQYINLIPIFEDYKTHFEDIKKKFDNDDSHPTKSNKNISSDQEKVSSLTSKNSSSSDSSHFSFGSSSTSGTKADPFPSGSTSSTSTVPFEKSNEKEKTLSEQKPFTFGLSKTASENPETTTTGSENKPSGLVFNFGKSNSNPAFSFGSDQSKLTFNFGATDTSSSSKTSDFSFGTSKDVKSTGFSFATTPVTAESKPEESKADECEVQEEEQMPEIKEEGAVYEKKAKLFHKKDAQYNTIGVGTLYIKPVKENDKSQLIVRADNSLGTVLLNILLNESIPTQRVGKNNVLIICVPNPPLDDKNTQTPASILIRVKTGDDADELFEKLNHYKNLNKSEDSEKDSN